MAAGAESKARIEVHRDAIARRLAPARADPQPSADLDLYMTGPNNTYVTGSGSWDNNSEIAEFTAPVEVRVVALANVDELSTPKRCSTPSLALPTAVGTEPG